MRIWLKAWTSMAHGDRLYPCDGELRATGVLSDEDFAARQPAQLIVGGERCGLFAARHNGAKVIFDDPAAFANANTPGELAALQINPRPP